MSPRYFVHMINISLKTVKEKLHNKLLQKLQIVKTVYKTPSVVLIRVPQYSVQQSAIKKVSVVEISCSFVNSWLSGT